MDIVRDLLHYWPVLTLFLNVLVAWAAWSMTKKFVTVDALNRYKAEVGDRLDELESYKDVMEERFKSLATAKDMYELKLAISRLEGRLEGALEGLSAQVGRMDLRVNRLTDYHLKEGVSHGA